MTLWFRVKSLLKSIPVIGPFLVHLRERQEKFRNSSAYWERRYRTGGNSGAGSYNRLAEFKANFLNRFVEEHQIASVVEYGSGDGAQLKLARYPTYTGVDISATAVEMCRALFSADTSKRFLHLDVAMAGPIGDLSLSLDVVYHLVEDAVFNAYMWRLFESARRFVIVYSSNIDQDWTGQHVRHRQFTKWVEQNKPDWFLQSTLKNAYPYNPADPEQTSFADFYVFAPS
jgi:SAM-dependent methyltransferase